MSNRRLYPTAGHVELTVVEGSRFRVQSLMRLLKHFPALATVPAIDYEAYLPRFQREGEVSS